MGHLDAPGARRVRRQLGARALVLGQPDLGSLAVLNTLASIRPEILLSWFWPKQIPEAVLKLPERGSYGVHPSLLPRWRGPDPYFWAIYAGDAQTGVSLHALEAEYDTGDVLAQEQLAIHAAENSWSLARRLDRLGLRLLVDAAAGFAAGRSWPRQPQASRAISQAPKPDDATLAIDWTRDADSILRLIRAAAPYPGACAELGDELVEVLEAEPCPRDLPSALQPAEAAQLGDRLVVQTGRGGVLIQRVRTLAGEVLRGTEITQLFPHSLSRV